MDEDKLADAYNEALSLEKSGDFDAAALAYLKVLEIDPDDHGGASVRLASMKKGLAPKRAPQAYISTLFDQHAEVFDRILVDDLGYDVPKLTANLLQANGLNKFENLLDLGCGTGLMGVALSSTAENMTGVDLSENMIEIAFDRDIYNALYVADVEDYLDDNDEDKWDIICAGDVFPYLGDIDNFATGIANNLNENGYFAFSTETLPDDQFGSNGFTVTAYQRFAHRFDYLEATLKSQKLNIIKADDIIVRHEQGKPILGHLVLAKKYS